MPAGGGTDKLPLHPSLHGRLGSPEENGGGGRNVGPSQPHCHPLPARSGTRVQEPKPKKSRGESPSPFPAAPPLHAARAGRLHSRASPGTARRRDLSPTFQGFRPRPLVPTQTRAASRRARSRRGQAPITRRTAALIGWRRASRPPIGRRRRPRPTQGAAYFGSGVLGPAPRAAPSAAPRPSRAARAAPGQAGRRRSGAVAATAAHVRPARARRCGLRPAGTMHTPGSVDAGEARAVSAGAGRGSATRGPRGPSRGGGVPGRAPQSRRDGQGACAPRRLTCALSRAPRPPRPTPCCFQP